MYSEEIKMRSFGEKGWFQGLELLPQDFEYGRDHGGLTV